MNTSELEFRGRIARRLRGARNALLSVLAGLVVAAGAASVVDADDDDDEEMSEHEAVRFAVKRGEVMPLARILAIALKEIPGDVVEVELERDDGRIVYEIKVLTDNGRVREVRLDARTGGILDIEDD